MRVRHGLLMPYIVALMCWSAFGFTIDTTPVHRNFISFNPVALLAGGISANYERVSGRNGLFVEGEYIFPMLKSSGYEFAAAYRFHFRQSDIGGFFGPFIKFGSIGSALSDESKNEFRYKFRYATAGLSVGKRGSLWARHHWLYSYRIGLGYPLQQGWSWNTTPPDKINGVSVDFMKKIIGIPAYFDSELGFSFGF